MSLLDMGNVGPCFKTAEISSVFYPYFLITHIYKNFWKTELKQLIKK